MDLNVDWIHTQTRLYDENQEITKENMKSINIHQIFINLKSEVVKVLNSGYTSGDNETILPSSEILKLALENKYTNDKKYKIFDLLLFNIDLDIQEQSKIDELFEQDFLKKKTILTDMIIPPTLFIFHDINCVYIIYKEVQKSKNNLNITLKKALFNSR